MNKIKRMITILLALALILNLAAAGALAKAPDGKGKPANTGLAKAAKNKEFSDMKGHWAEQYLDGINTKGVIKGYEDGTFKPDKSVTKGETITMLMRMLDAEFDTSNLVIPDVVKNNDNIDAWAKPYVALALEKDVLTEDEVVELFSSEEAQRYQVAVWLARALGLGGQAVNQNDAVLPYVDSTEIPAWAKGHVKVLFDEEIMRGNPDKTFKANKGILRAEMASLLFQSMKPAKGVIKEVDESASTITLAVYGNPRFITECNLTLEDDRTVVIDVYENAEVWIDDTKGMELGDLKEGYRATIVMDSETCEATHILAKTTPQSLMLEGKVKEESTEPEEEEEEVVEDIDDGIVEGTITNIKNNKIITIDGEKKYSLNSKVEIEIDGEEASASDLSVDMVVELEFENGELVKVKG